MKKFSEDQKTELAYFLEEFDFDREDEIVCLQEEQRDELEDFRTDQKDDMRQLKAEIKERRKEYKREMIEQILECDFESEDV